MAEVALITGASSGLGREFARLFAADHHDLVLVARRRERLEELAGELQASCGVTAHVLVADLSDSQGVNEVVEEVERLGLTVSHLVNNAGFGTNGAFLDSQPERELAMVQLNDAAPLALTRAFLPAMVVIASGASSTSAPRRASSPAPTWPPTTLARPSSVPSARRSPRSCGARA
jgi:short-subunit dehydrogenase